MHPAFTMDLEELGTWMYVACGKLELKGDPPSTTGAYVTDPRFRPAARHILYKLGYRVEQAGPSALLMISPRGRAMEIPGRANDQKSYARAAVWAAWREGVMGEG